MKTRSIIDDDGRFPQRDNPFFGRRGKSVGGAFTQHHFDEGGCRNGLKKCRPRKLTGRSSSFASPSTEGEDVLDAKYESKDNRASMPRRAVTFRSQSSGTASTTNCRSAKESWSVPTPVE